MEKLQILFPEPALRRLRGLAAQEDRPVSELVRLAVDRFLQQTPLVPAKLPAFPTFRGGGVQVSAEDLKAEIYADDAV